MIPVYINTFNRLTTTRNLVEQLKRVPDAQPVIVDNDSKYEPLLDWYATNPCDIVRLRENLGHHAPWLSGVISNDDAQRYVVTDCDIDIEGVPVDVLSVLQSAFEWRLHKPVKSGLALRLDDLPPWQTEVKTWEARFWTRRVSHDWRFYHGEIDTTFAMYESSTPFEMAMSVPKAKAVRLAGEYQARHMPWYLDCTNLDDENRNYFATSNRSNSWKPHGQSLSASYSHG